MKTKELYDFIKNNPVIEGSNEEIVTKLDEIYDAFIYIVLSIVDEKTAENFSDELNEYSAELFRIKNECDIKFRYHYSYYSHFFNFCASYLMLKFEIGDWCKRNVRFLAIRKALEGLIIKEIKK